MGRFRTWETLLLLAVALVAIAAGGVATRLAWGWTLALGVSFLLFAYIPLAVRLQDWLLERYLARGRFSSALRVASAIRDSARAGINQDLAEFEVGLVHLARGANADAVRSFRRVNRVRLKARTKVVVAVYTALAELRNETQDQVPRANAVLKAVSEAAEAMSEDPYLLAAHAEARLALGEAAGARDLLEQSLALTDDAYDPSPGERYVLHARAAAGAGHRDVAIQSYRVAAQLRADGPFVRAARAELAALESRS